MMADVTLTEFLLARIAEESTRLTHYWTSRDPDAQKLRARMLAQCEANRRIVARHSGCDDTSFGEPCEDLRDLGGVYADHPDYDPDWRP